LLKLLEERRILLPETMGPVSYSSETYDLVSRAWLCLFERITERPGRAGVGWKSFFPSVRLLALLLAEGEPERFLTPVQWALASLRSGLGQWGDCRRQRCAHREPAWCGCGRCDPRVPGIPLGTAA